MCLGFCQKPESKQKQDAQQVVNVLLFISVGSQNAACVFFQRAPAVRRHFKLKTWAAFLKAAPIDVFLDGNWIELLRVIFKKTNPQRFISLRFQANFLIQVSLAEMY